jgi:hypothetical protein
MVGLISLLIMPACATDDEKAQDGPLAAGGQDAGPVVDARPHDATNAPDVLNCAEGIAYTTPGCGSAAPAPRCGGLCDVGVPGDVFCGCDGVTFEGSCGYSHKPYAKAGPCEDATTLVDAKPDALMCADGIGYDRPGCGPAAPKPRCAGDSDVGCAHLFCGCDGVTFQGGCGISPRPFAKAGVCDGPSLFDARPDALACGRFETVAYNTPGCGSAAPAAYCQGPTDACSQIFCGCDGLTFWGGCGFSHKPFAHWGACPDGGPDGGSG